LQIAQEISFPFSRGINQNTVKKQILCMVKKKKGSPAASTAIIVLTNEAKCI
jgi:hypothetical protein